MICKAFALLDTKVGTFSVPFFVRHDAEAVRIAQGVASDPNTVPGRHPEDFLLMELGLFDDSTGKFESGLLTNHGVISSFIQRRPDPGSSLFPDMPVDPKLPTRPVPNGVAVASHEVA